jgi:hypothetical protein
VPGLGAGAAVEVDQRGELARLAADDRHHQRQSQQPCAHERLRRAADADPDRQRVLDRARVDALPDQGRPVPTRPGHLGPVADLQQQLELLAEQGVVVGEVEAEQREGLGEGPAADHEVDPPLRDEVQRRELLEDAHRVRRAQHRHRTAEPDALGAGGRRGEDDRRCGVVVLAAVVLADAEGVQPDSVRKRDLLQEVLHPLRRADHVAGGRVGDGGDEAVDAKMHGPIEAPTPRRPVRSSPRGPAGQHRRR